MHVLVLRKVLLELISKALSIQYNFIEIFSIIRLFILFKLTSKEKESAKVFTNINIIA
jgi:hypothetical protein